MHKYEFEIHFREAAERVVTFTREYIEEHLPDQIRVNLQLNSSHDANLIPEYEVVYPDDHITIPRERVSDITLEEAVDVLWRDGRVPEWINLSVEGTDNEITIIEAVCCGRFTDTEDLLYHHREGLPPFHVLGPPVRHDNSLMPEKAQFSIYRHVELRDVKDLSQLERGRNKIEHLVLSGPDFDDNVLRDLGTLPKLDYLQLMRTRVQGYGLSRFHSLKRLGVYFIDGTSFSLEEIGCLPSLTHLSVDGVPTELLYLEAISNLDLLKILYLPLAQVKSIEFLAALGRLRSLTLHDTLVHCLEPLKELKGLKDLDLSRIPAPAEEFRHLSGLNDLEYCLVLEGTRITDEALANIRSFAHLGNLIVRKTNLTDNCLDMLLELPKLWRLDLRETRISAIACEMLKSEKPGLCLLSDYEYPPLKKEYE